MIKLNKIHNFDCLKGLKKLPDESVDLLVTDPPYGYSFMGKDWDKAVPSVNIWKESLRVLKPGAFAFVMSAPRQDVQMQMIQHLTNAGFQTSFTPIYWTYATGFPKAMNIGKKRKERVLQGAYAGFQPKPAVEVTLVAMKPLSKKTFVDQALKNGKGVTWLDDCRIPYENSMDKEGSRSGRFPANLLVSDDVLGVPSAGALAPVRSRQKGFGGVIYGKYKSSGDNGDSFYSDKENSKSFSRYFSLDAWWQKHISQLPNDVQKTFPFLIVPKACKSEKNAGCERLNHHPTVKPIKLMSYLITLGSQKNDLVLDPFMGSGTTAIAAKHLERNFIGFEMNPEYINIANKRLKRIN